MHILFPHSCSAMKPHQLCLASVQRHTHEHTRACAQGHNSSQKCLHKLQTCIPLTCSFGKLHPALADKHYLRTSDENQRIHDARFHMLQQQQSPALKQAARPSTADGSRQGHSGGGRARSSWSALKQVRSKTENKEKTAPFGFNQTRSLVLYCAAQGASELLRFDCCTALGLQDYTREQATNGGCWQKLTHQDLDFCMLLSDRYHHAERHVDRVAPNNVAAQHRHWLGARLLFAGAKTSPIANLTCCCCASCFAT